MKNLRRADIPKDATNLSNSEIEKYYAKIVLRGRSCYAYFTVVHPKYSTGVEYVRRNVVAYLN